MQLFGREPTSLGLIAHRRNHYAMDTEANQENIYIYNKSYIGNKIIGCFRHCLHTNF